MKKLLMLAAILTAPAALPQDAQSRKTRRR